MEVQNRFGRYVVPSLDECVGCHRGAADHIPDDVRYSLVDVPWEEPYPVCGTVCVFVVTSAEGIPDADAVAFLEWVAHAGQAHVTDLRYAPLPAALPLRVDETYDRLKAKP